MTLKTFMGMRLSLSTQLAEKVMEYHQQLVTGGIAGYPVDTVRELIQIGLSSDPASLVPDIVRQNTYSEAKIFIFQRIGAAFNEIKSEFQKLAAERGLEDPFPPDEDR